LDDLKHHLQGLGADIILTYDDLADKGLRNQVKEWTADSPIKLMLNCVGGKHIPRMVSLLGSGAYVVSYGAMSKEPMPISTSSLLFKDIQYRGFWQTRWNQQKTGEERLSLFKKIAEMKLEEPAHEIVTLSAQQSDLEVSVEVKEFIAKMSQGQYGKKVLLKFEDPLT